MKYLWIGPAVIVLFIVYFMVLTLKGGIAIHKENSDVRATCEATEFYDCSK